MLDRQIENQLKKRDWAILLALVTILISYTTLRAAFVPMTFDEIWSFRSYASAPIKAILNFSFPTANNHPGNSLLMKASMAIFGNSPFALRLPNLLAHGLFLFYSVQISRKQKQVFWVFATFFLINFNPYILDFFALARGYGLALGFSTAAIYHLLTFAEHPKTKHLIWNSGFFILAVFCNFSFLHLFLANGLALFLIILSHLIPQKLGFKLTGKSIAFQILPFFIACILLFLYMREPVAALIKAKQLYYGGLTGFWTDTVSSLVQGWYYLIDYWSLDLSLLLKLVLVLMLLMFAAFALQISDNNWDFRKSLGIIFFIMLISISVTTTIQHFKAESPFLIFRTAIFIYPLFFLAFVYMTKYITQIPGLKGFGYTLLIGMLCLTAVNNVMSWNLRYACEWKFDSKTPEMLHDLEIEKNKLSPPKSKIRLGVGWEMRPGVNYYIDYLKIDWLEPIDDKGCQPGYDFYYILGSGIGCKLSRDLLPFGKKQGMINLKEYYQAESSLWKNPDPTKETF